MTSTKLVAGVDEVGRGPLAGPVLAVAVILAPNGIDGLKDSKKLSERKRQLLSVNIKQSAIAWAYGVASVKEIDKLNILNASLLAMARAVGHLPIKPHEVLVDGNQCPKIDLPVKAIVGGDNLISQISAASIVAKVMRDHLMNYFDKHYPVYGFAKHKGYGTKAHMLALKKYGASPIHRQSFKPVKEQLG